MTFAEFLFYASGIVYVAVNVTVTFYAFPAYKRRRELAFLLLTFSGGLGVFLTVFDYTLGRQPMAQAEYYRWWCARQTAYILDSLCWGAAVLLLLRVIAPQPPKATLREYVTPQEQSPRA